MEYDDFIFPERLKEQLEFLLNNPRKIPSPLCFYGLPAKGKTEFAKFLGEKLAKDTFYYDCNEFIHDIDFVTGVRKISYTYPIEVDEERKNNTLGKCFILDEWHNLPAKKQDLFKTFFDNPPSKNIYIVCCNTDSKNKLRNVLTAPIYSRFHFIRFDLFARDLDEVIEKTKDKFPMLDDDFIRNNILDYRAITREVKMKAVPEI